VEQVVVEIQLHTMVILVVQVAVLEVVYQVLQRLLVQVTNLQ
jgi:hypothetical protein